MKVRIRVQPTGLLNGKPWPAVGESLDVPDVVAVDLLNAEVAEAVQDVAKIEAAIASIPTAKAVAVNARAKPKAR